VAVGVVAGQAPAQGVEAIVVPVQQRVERTAVTRLGGGDERAVVGVECDAQRVGAGRPEGGSGPVPAQLATRTSASSTWLASPRSVIQTSTAPPLASPRSAVTVSPVPSTEVTGSPHASSVSCGRSET
jgi:hypothetical protein